MRDFARDMVQRIALEDMKAAEQAKAAGFELVNWSAEERRKFRQLSEAILGRLGQEKLDRAESLRQPDRFPEKTAAAVDWSCALVPRPRSGGCKTWRASKV